MEEYLYTLQNTALFAGLPPRQLREALACLGAKKRSYGKGEAIFHAGQRISCMGVLLCGQVHIQRDDYWGNRSLLAEISPGELFGEAYAVGEEPMCNDVVACRESTVLLMDADRLLAPCTAACGLHVQLLHRLFSIFAQKNRAFHSAPHGKNCCTIFPSRQKRRAGKVFQFPLIASSWQITSRWTAAPCVQSWAACAAMG